MADDPGPGMQAAPGRSSGVGRRRRVWLLAASLVVLGAVIIAVGRQWHNLSAYDQSAFVNVGTAVALLAPFVLLERFLQRRISAVGAHAQAARTSAVAASETAQLALTRVDELSARVQGRLWELRREDRELRDRAATGESQSDFVALYERAAGNRSIDRLGLRLSAPDPLDWWIRVRAVERAPEGERQDFVELSFEDGRLETIGRMAIWSPGQPIEDVFVDLATGLQDAGVWPGDDAFDASAILDQVAAALDRVIDIRTGFYGDPKVRQIAEVVNESWVVTREGLDSLRTAGVWAEHYELVGDTHLAFQRLERQVKARGWDEAEFREAFEEAVRIHAAFAEASPGKGPFSKS